MRVFNQKSLERKPDASDRTRVEQLSQQKTHRQHPPERHTFREKPWGVEYALLQDQRFDVWELQLHRSSATSTHAHRNKDAFVLVLQGVLELKISTKTERLRSGECRLLKKNVIHQLVNKGRTPLRLIEIESPANRHDLVRVDDPYGRVGLPYAHTKNSRGKRSVKSPCKHGYLSFKQIESHPLYEVCQLAADGQRTPGRKVYSFTIRKSSLKDHSLTQDIQARMIRFRVSSYIILRGNITVKRLGQLTPGDILVGVEPTRLTHIAANTVFLAW